jgi:formylglycine-generating enzyme required for sulfatase activity/predicted Ser/Thr protein kinase
MTEPSVSSTLMGSLPPGTRLHEYEIEKVLGHGGFGITYLARDKHLDKRVAIKEYLPNDLAARAPDQTVTVRSPEVREAFKWGLESFIKEARVLGKFSHPSLIQVHRYFEANDTAYFVMEYAEGVTLASVLKHEGTLSEERLRKIIFPILNGLEEVHRTGVLHRDIKPDNIILREGSLPVLIDFGAARQNLSSMTRSVMSVLTAGYAPIEQYATTGNQGPWTDLYAIGAVAYRALSGKKPIDAVNRIRDDPMVPATMLGQGRYSSHFLAAIDWALAVNPEDRPTSIADFKLALDGQTSPPSGGPVATRISGIVTKINPQSPGAAAQAAEDRTVVTRKFVLPGLPPMFVARKPMMMWGAAAGAVLVAGLVALFFAMRDKAAPPPVKAEPAPATAPAQPPPAAVAEAPKPAAPATETPAAEAPAARAAPAPKPARKPAAPAKAKLVPVAQMAPLSVFQDCPDCPIMVALAAGSYQMGATAADNPNKWETPAHPVALGKAFAIGRHEITAGEWRACVNAKACAALTPGPGIGEPTKLPVVNITWADARAYTEWLSKAAGRTYRLPSEAEWEYAIRARTASSRYWGGDRTRQCQFGNGADRAALKKDAKLPAAECNDGFAQLAPVGAFEPNAFGLFDMAGNAWEWTQDCWRDTYAGAPADGSALEFPGCDRRVIRGGSWRARANSLRSFGRGNSLPDLRSEDLGLRVAAE